MLSNMRPSSHISFLMQWMKLAKWSLAMVKRSQWRLRWRARTGKIKTKMARRSSRCTYSKLTLERKTLVGSEQSLLP